MGDPIRLFPASGPDGGMAKSEACRLTATPVMGDAGTVVGATGASFLDLASQPFATRLTWADGGYTRLSVTLSEIEVLSTKAKRDLALDPWYQQSACKDHVTIRAALALRTDDGRLDEHVSRIELVAYDDFEAHGSTVIKADTLAGSYTSSARDGYCFASLKLRLLIARDGCHGTLSEHTVLGGCDVVDGASEELSAASWGARAQNYGD